jgi:hypothetical protein
MYRKLIVAFFGAALLSACSSSPAPSPTARTGSSTGPAPSTPVPSMASGYSPAIDPANFVTTIDNPYFPLVPGTTFVYEGVRDGQNQRDEVVVTHETKVIQGVTCVVVQDTATHAGTLLEKTEDWYAQDAEGNVWYFGEDTAEYEDGQVSSTEGSWQSGVDGAQPGIVMDAHPEVPTSYRQEYYKGQAEDMAWVVSLGRPVDVPFGSFEDGLLTIEWSPLEPKVIDEKYYAPGVGLVLEVAAAGGDERAELVSVTTSQ